MHHVLPLVATALACALALVPGAAFAQATPQAALGTAPPAAAAGNPVEHGVLAEAVAENAVLARERALAAGQREAYRRIAPRFGLPLSASDAEIEALIDSITIEEERATRTAYSARLTVVFSAAAIAARSRGEPPPPPMGGLGGPAAATIDAAADFATFPEWLELRRRLLAHPQVARVQILSIATDGARLRLFLRDSPEAAAAALAGAGVALQPAEGRQGVAWRVGLGRGL
jgi:hypothetical protein